MSATPLRPILRPHYASAIKAPVAARRVRSTEAMSAMLLREGVVSAQDMVRALTLQSRQRGRLIDILLSRDLADETALYAALGRFWSVSVASLIATPADPRLIDQLGAVRCLRDGVLPWRSAGGATVIVTANPESFRRHRDGLTAIFGPLVMAVAPARQIEEAVLRTHGQTLALGAETRVGADESCRSFDWASLRAHLLVGASTMTGAAVLWPAIVLSALTVVALLTMMSFTALKIAAGFAARRPAPPQLRQPHIARLPIVSAIIALYRESEIIPRLVMRLDRLDYPRELLDVLLVVEVDDDTTRSALAAADLQKWMRVVVVPNGTVKTKPRALNFALDLCRGSIIGVYDAEDAPAADQIRKVVDRFHQRGPNVACLQGILDFYNPHTNWLSRCFTIEYASWFRIFLPGIERLGLAVPLGGTTLFFRRAALEALGGWDAHNVTEDADLGIRIARHGYRTELIDTVTEEEANCRALPWVKQRSRWIKGFMMTWATHMRSPSLLWRQLGTWRFVGFQVLMLGSIGHALLAPLLWSLWLVPFGLPHPVADALPDPVFNTMAVSFLCTEIVALCFGVIGLSKTKHKLSPLWVPTLYVYHPLATLAAYKALWELLTRPFYWDKTSHGHFDGHS